MASEAEATSASMMRIRTPQPVSPDPCFVHLSITLLPCLSLSLSAFLSLSLLATDPLASLLL